MGTVKGGLIGRAEEPGETHVLRATTKAIHLKLAFGFISHEFRKLAWTSFDTSTDTHRRVVEKERQLSLIADPRRLKSQNTVSSGTERPPRLVRRVARAVPCIAMPCYLVVTRSKNCSFETIRTISPCAEALNRSQWAKPARSAAALSGM